jgi:2-methylcitrate dehydratase PrpD
MNHSRLLAEFCSQISFDNLPEEVVYKTKLCILDCIANIYGSRELEAVKHVADYIRSQQGALQASALGWNFETTVNDAAFINGTAAEAIEAQDGLRFGGNHPGTAVIPAAFAVAEHLGLGGREIVEAVVAGYEAANRPAAAMHPWHTLSGFLPTGTCGTFGAATAAAKLYRFDSNRMLNALGNAGYLLPLSMAEHLMGGYTIKIVQGGQAASAGIRAAGLAGSGITGAPYVLEGSELNGGFTKITTNVEPNMDKIIEGLGEHFTIMDVYFKPYTACRHTHGAIQATLEIVKREKIFPADIEKVEVYTYGIAVIAVGKGVKDNDTFVSAQFSIPYCVAACLTDGEFGPQQMKEARIEDPGVIELSRKVLVLMDDDLNNIYPDMTSSRVKIFLKDGRKLVQQIDIPKGDPRDPMDEKEISQKVRYFAGDKSGGRVDKVISMILDIENMANIKELARLI